MGSGLQSAAKIGVAAVGAATAGIGGLVAGAVSGYAEYEQLVGGVETLFGNSANTVMQYANNAYQTAGLSANEYMSTVTSFSASLLQSLGGDTAEAAEYANQALTDMSDNANKMGTDMAMIQNAYQGFAKQNYTMLDNLKLGYGGTKSEMERLIADANAVKVANGEMADLSIESFADVVDAIHIVQTEMGITGTTAQEAGDTISGSVAATKAAWSNLVTGMANENANMDQLVSNLVTTASTAAGNIIPVVQTAIAGAGTLVSTLVPQVFAALPTFVSETLPGLIGSAMTTVESIATAIPGVIGSVADIITQQAGTIAASAGNIVSSLVNGLVAALPSVMAAGATLLTSLAGTIAEGAPQIMSAAAEIAVQLINGLTSAAPGVIGSAATIITSFATGLAQNAPQILGAAAGLIASLAEGISTALPTVLPAVTAAVAQIATAFADPGLLNTILQAGLQLILALADGITAATPSIAAALPGIILSIVDFIIAAIPQIIDAGAQLVAGLVSGIADNWGAAESMWSELIPGLAEAAGAYAGMWAEIGSDIVDGILSGLQNAWAAVTNWFSEAWAGLFASAQTANDIHSPSKLYAKLGKNIALGVGVGWNNTFPAVADSVIGSMNAMNQDASASLDTVSFGHSYGSASIAHVSPSESVMGSTGGAGGGEVLGVLHQILTVLTAQNDNMGASMREALENVSLSVNKREFGRLVNATGGA